MTNKTSEEHYNTPKLNHHLTEEVETLADHAQATDDQKTRDHSHDGHSHGNPKADGWRSHWNLLTSLAILLVMQTFEYGFQIKLSSLSELFIYLSAYLLAGYNV